MSDDMNLSINGQSQVPPGFRFHPTEEELLHYYLRKKVAFEKIDLDVIREVDLNKLEPWDIQEKCKIGSTPQNDWYFFSHKDKKYPTGTRTNRATAAGFWKATGRDKIIYSGFRRIGLRKTLVFYKGRAPHGQKSDWIMHEYRLDETTSNDSTIPNPISGDSASSEDGWVVCRVFKKKNYQKALDSPKASPISMDSNNPIALHHHHQIMPCSARNDGVLDQILHYMGRTCKLENDHSLTNTIKNSTNSLIGHHNVDLDHHHHHHQTALNERFMHLPRLESPTLHSVPFNHHCYKSMDEILLETEHQNDVAPPNNHHHHHHGNNNKPSSTAQLNDWVALDRLVASQLNGGQDPTMTASFCSPSPDPATAAAAADEDEAVVDAEHLSSSYNPYGLRSKLSQSANSIYVGGDADLWSSFAARSSPSPSSSDPLCHLSV